MSIHYGARRRSKKVQPVPIWKIEIQPRDRRATYCAPEVFPFAGTRSQMLKATAERVARVAFVPGKVRIFRLEFQGRGIQLPANEAAVSIEGVIW